MDSRITIQQSPECHITISEKGAGLPTGLWQVECTCGWGTIEFGAVGQPGAVFKSLKKDDVIKAAEEHLKMMDGIRTATE